MVSVSQHYVEPLNKIREKTETSCQHPIASSLDMTSEVDVTADTSWGEHSPLFQVIDVLNQQRFSIRLRYVIVVISDLQHGKTDPNFQNIVFLIIVEVNLRIFKSVAQVN